MSGLGSCSQPSASRRAHASWLLASQREHVSSPRPRRRRRDVHALPRRHRPRRRACLHLPDDTTCTTPCQAARHAPVYECHAAPTALAELADARAHLTFDHARHAAPTVTIACAATSASPRATTACAHRWRHTFAVTITTPLATLANATPVIAISSTRASCPRPTSRTMATGCASTAPARRRQATCVSRVTATSSAPSVTARQSPCCPRPRGSTTRSQRRSIARGFTSRHALEARAQPGACTTCRTRCAARAVTLPSMSPRWPPEPAPTRLGRARRRPIMRMDAKHDEIRAHALAAMTAPVKRSASAVTGSEASAVIRIPRLVEPLAVERDAVSAVSSDRIATVTRRAWATRSLHDRRRARLRVQQSMASAPPSTCRVLSRGRRPAPVTARTSARSSAPTAMATWLHATFARAVRDEVPRRAR